MRSLDTLFPMRPKAEAGRAPAGEDSRTSGPGFEAVLDAFENGTAPAGEAPADPAEAGADAPPSQPGDLPVAPVANAADTAGSALQALMALTGPAAAPAPAAPDASLEAMVQRAAARSGTGPAPAAPGLPISVIGLETHFAPVRPHTAALPVTAETEPFSSGALNSSATPVSGGLDADGAPSALRDDARLPTSAPSAPAVGPVRIGATETGMIPAGGAHASAAGIDGSPTAQGASALAAPASVDRPPAAITASHGAATPAQPAPLDLERNPAAGASAASVATGTAATEALKGAASRGRAALRSDRMEQAGAVSSAPSLAEPSASGDLPEVPALPQPGPDGQVSRDPEPARERPTGIVRPETALERADASMPRAKADAEAGPGSASAGSSAEAPRPQMSLAEPVPHEMAGTSAPVPTSPLRQIVDAVATQLPAAASGASGRPAMVPAEAGPLKILTLQLHPADLGSVLVRMRLQDGRLEMSLRTSREETAERLRREGDMLSGLLREAGYEADTVTIQTGGTGPGETGTRGQGLASFAGSQGGQQDRQPGAATPDHSGRRPSPRADEAATPTEENDHETDSRRRDHGGLYL
ncbi:flagellar hook-length control protein FliK [Methylorubrum rhodesianum]|uniref:flagellar hook-length control protein FliK n=1 Tax=Methylorubrum rhodesianum TaxID=29427 RepID=UPI003CFF0378